MGDQRTEVFALLLVAVVAAQMTLTSCRPVTNGVDVPATKHGNGEAFWRWRVESILRRIERVLDESDDYPLAEEAPYDQGVGEEEEEDIFDWLEPTALKGPSKPFGQAIRDLLPKTAEDEPDFTEDFYPDLNDNLNWDFDKSDLTQEGKPNEILHSRKHHI